MKLDSTKFWEVSVISEENLVFMLHTHIDTKCVL